MTPEERARLCLTGLSLGDALGERFFSPRARQMVQQRRVPPGPWRYTDDTEMALSVTECLVEEGGIDPDRLAERFARRYDPRRGYGGGAHRLLRALRRGGCWQEEAPALFGGEGSFGNGAAMRVAPVGAWFASDLEQVREHAVRSARVTHAHPEGVAGAVAVAVAAALAWTMGEEGAWDRQRFFTNVLEVTPPGLTRQGIEVARRLPPEAGPEAAAERLGSGKGVSAQDTVPFALWCAACCPEDYREALWTTLRGGGDRDTTCAMVGGIVVLFCRRVPRDWLERREPLPGGFEEPWGF